MAPNERVFLRVTPGESGAVSEWTKTRENLHVHDHRFDEYDTEVISLASQMEHRPFIRALDWDETHRKWTGEAWKIDFAALDTVVHHLVDNGFPVTIDATIYRIYSGSRRKPTTSVVG